MVAVSAAVQNLQGDAATGCVDGIRNLAVFARLSRTHQGRAVGRQFSSPIG